MLDDVNCAPDLMSGHTLTMNFAVEEAYKEALQAWSEWPTFTLITAHPTCNEMDERGAWQYVHVFVRHIIDTVADMIVSLQSALCLRHCLAVAN